VEVRVTRLEMLVQYDLDVKLTEILEGEEVTSAIPSIRKAE